MYDVNIGRLIRHDNMQAYASFREHLCGVQYVLRQGFDMAHAINMTDSKQREKYKEKNTKRKKNTKNRPD